MDLIVSVAFLFTLHFESGLFSILILNFVTFVFLIVSVLFLSVLHLCSLVFYISFSSSGVNLRKRGVITIDCSLIIWDTVGLVSMKLGHAMRKPVFGALRPRMTQKTACSATEAR